MTQRTEHDAPEAAAPAGARPRRRHWLRLLFWLPPALLAVALLLVICTQWGLQQVWNQVGPRLPDGISVAAVEGTIAGPLIVRGVKVRQPGLELSLDEARLNVRFSRLLLARVQIAELYAADIDIKLHPSEVAADPEPESGPLRLNVRAPVSLIVERAQIRDFSLQPSPEAEVETVDSLELQAQWTPGRLDIERLELRSPRTGALQATLSAALDSNRVTIEALRVAEIDGALALEARGSVHQTGDTVETLDMALDAAWQDIRWPLQGDELLLRSPSGRIDAQGRLDDLTAEITAKLQSRNGPASIDLAGTRRGQTIDARLAWDNLAWPLEAPPQVRTPGGRIKINGTLDQYTIDGGADLILPNPPSADDTEAAASVNAAAPQGPLEARFDLDGQGSLEDLRIRALTVTALQTTAQLSGQVGWKDAITAEFNLAADQVNPANLVPALADYPGNLTVRSAGKVRVQDNGVHADLSRLDVRGTLKGEQARLSANGTVTPQQIVVREFELKALEATARGVANVQLKPLSGTAQAQLRNINPGVLAAQFPGALDGLASVAFSTEDGVRVIRTEALSLEGTLRDRPLELLASAELRGETAKINFVRARSGTSRLEARGVVTDRLDVRAEVRSDDLADFWPGLAGELTADVKAAGPLARPRVTATTQARNLRYQSYALDALELDADVDLADGSVLNLDTTASGLSAAGQQVKSLAVKISGSAARHEAAVTLDSIDLAASLQANGSIDVNSYQWQGALDALTLTPLELGQWVLEQPVDLIAGPRRVELSNACLGHTPPEDSPAARAGGQPSRLCLSADQTRERLLALAQIDRFDYSYIVPLLPPGSTATGYLDGTAVYGIKGDLSTAEIDLKTSAGRLAGKPPGQEERVELVFEPGSIYASDSPEALRASIDLPLGAADPDDGDTSTIGGTQASISFAGREQISLRPMDGQLDMQINDLEALALFFPDLSDVTGELIGDLKLAGTLAEPRFDGTLALNDGAASIDLIGIDVRKLNVRATAKDSPEVRFELGAESDGGPIKLSGRGNFVGERSVDATVTGNRFLAYDTEEGSVYISPDLTLELRGREAELTGSVTVPKANITPTNRDSGPQAVKVSADQIIVGPATTQTEDQALRVTTEVKLIIGDEVRVEGFGLKAGITGKITARSKPGRETTATGELRLVDGAYKAYGQNLDIQTGRLIFAGGPVTSPGVDVRAARYPREGLEVGVRVRGSIEQPTFRLYSEPGLTQQDQLSYLVLGRSLENQGGTTGGEQAALTNAALGLGLSQTGFLSDFLRDDIGLDDVQIGAGAGQSTGQAALILGKWLTPKLYVSYGVGLLEPGQSVSLRYSLSSKWTLETEAGAETGGDVIYTIER